MSYKKYKKVPIETLIVGEYEFVPHAKKEDLWAMPGRFFLTTKQVEAFAEKEGLSVNRGLL